MGIHHWLGAVCCLILRLSRVVELGRRPWECGVFPGAGGIQLRSVTATIEGEMNVLGILGADPEVRNGFEAVTVRFAIDADASRDELEAPIAQSRKRSAVFDIVTNPTNVRVALA